MDQAIAAVVSWLLNQGWIGLGYIFLGWVLWDQKKQLRECSDRIAELQNKRVEDAQEAARELTETINAVRAGLQVNTELLKESRRGR